MLTEERFAEILRMLGEEKSVTVQELSPVIPFPQVLSGLFGSSILKLPVSP